ncbi:MAG: hypothetical protein ABI210_05560 [Abditibacteriaceae bacterium]
MPNAPESEFQVEIQKRSAPSSRGGSRVISALMNGPRVVGIDAR